MKDESTALAALLRACAKNKDLRRGARIHDDILKRGLLVKLSDSLVIMYAKCGALLKAQELFDAHKSRDVCTWTALIGGCVQHGRGKNALDYFEHMRCEGLCPDRVTFICAMKACGSIGAVDKGEQLHDEIAKQGFLGNDIMLCNAVVDMYAKCGALLKARDVLEELPVRTVVSWNSLIAGCAQHGQAEEALSCFERMQEDGISPDVVTFTCILKAYGSLGAANKGENLHIEISKQGLLGSDIVLGNALVDMYAKCGALAKARQVLEQLPFRNIITWSSLIAGYAQQTEGEQALECFEQMRREGLWPDPVTFLCIVKACGSIGSSEKGEKVHSELIKQGCLGNDVVLGTTLVDMYAKCRALSNARQVLQELPIRDVIAWNALIAGCAEQGEGAQALKCFEQMQDDGLSPDAVTFTCVLKACGTIEAANMGEQIHNEVAKQGLLGSTIELGNALIDMYVKCGNVAKARQVLEELPVRDAVSWSALITGYVQQGEGEQALDCFDRMQQEGLSPHEVTFVCILKACGSIGAVDRGEKIHHDVAKQGLLKNFSALGNAVVDMYARSGAVAKAHKAIEELPNRDAIAWNALIAGYIQEGHSVEALSCFEQMKREDIPPDEVTFSSVLSAFSRLGLIEDAKQLFMRMTTEYGLKPDIEHYTCMVDLFGRAGQLDKAIGVIERMSVTTRGVWSALLGACQKWGDVNVGRWAFEQGIQVDKYDSAAYVLMANIYVAAGMQEDAQRIEALRIENKAWKFPLQGWSVGLRGKADVNKEPTII